MLKLLVQGPCWSITALGDEAFEWEKHFSLTRSLVAREEGLTSWRMMQKELISTCSSAPSKISLLSWPKLAVGTLDPSTHLGQRPSPTLKVYMGVHFYIQRKHNKDSNKVVYSANLQSGDWSSPLDIRSN